MSERVRRYLDGFAAGVHRLEAPATLLDTGLPPDLREVYRVFDGGEMFHGAIVLVPSREVRRDGDRLRVGEVDGDDVEIDTANGSVWRLEKDTGEWLEEGSRFECWLMGALEAEEVVHDRDGEFRDDVFDDNGEPTPETVVRRERCLLRRDKNAPAPRWRLSRALVRLEQSDAARDELERVVQGRPAFAWAWYDLGRVSEQMGQIEAATEEVREAAETATDREQSAFFWAHAARLYALSGDDDGRHACATRAAEESPDIARVHAAAARECLAGDDRDSAQAHADLAAAIAPRDLDVLDLLRRLR